MINQQYYASKNKRNPLLKKTNKGKNNSYYMYGKHSVIAAIQNPHRNIEKIYCLEKQYILLKNIIPSTIELKTVPNEFITSKIGKDQAHQGIIAKVKTIFHYNIEQINFAEINKIAIFDQITDPQNIGAIIRSGVAFGINHFILPIDNTPEENAIIAKAACGCLELAKVIKVTNLQQIISKLKKQNFWIAGLDANGPDHIKELSNITKLAIIIGSEGKGLRHLTSQVCDFLVNIPIIAGVESLNAANAASIIFYEVSNLPKR